MNPRMRATAQVRVIRQCQERMERGAEIAFDARSADQVAACRRMLRYVAMIRWLYARARRNNAEIAQAFRDGCLGKPWPYGGLDNEDETYFRFMATDKYEDVTEEYA